VSRRRLHSRYDNSVPRAETGTIGIYAGGAISLDGTGYVQYTLANPFDRRLELAIELKTVSSDGVLLHGRGTHDYHTLEVRLLSLSCCHSD
jgi:hypothetical protein